MTSVPEIMIDVNDLGKTYTGRSRPVEVFRDLSLEIAAGEFVAVMGPSGAGKSTLLQLLGCLDSPTTGSYRLDGQEVARLSEPELARMRARCIGFVFQSSHFVDYLTLEDNVALAGTYAGTRDIRQARTKARQLLDEVGLAHRCTHRPAELSGGERQRAALARAVFNQPRLLLADEPTGNLDRPNANRMRSLLSALNKAGTTVLMVTHDAAMATVATRNLALEDGQLRAIQ